MTSNAPRLSSIAELSDTVPPKVAPAGAPVNFANRLLAKLGADDLAILADRFEPVELPRAFTFSAPDIAAEHAYFIEAGIGSIVAITPKGQRSEVGIFGPEGMTPAGLVLDTASTPYSIFMQVPGHGYRIRCEDLRGAIGESAKLRHLLSRYAHALSVQTSYTGLSNSVHRIDERLARWILMCHDRTAGDRIALTHEFLSVMLAVRRSSVTTALHVLEGLHLVYSERNLITVRDRPALERFAGDAYGVPEREYARLLGPMR
jgi:CRP-like cAMP-binding protein